MKIPHNHLNSGNPYTYMLNMLRFNDNYTDFHLKKCVAQTPKLREKSPNTIMLKRNPKCPCAYPPRPKI